MSQWLNLTFWFSGKRDSDWVPYPCILQVHRNFSFVLGSRGKAIQIVISSQVRWKCFVGCCAFNITFGCTVDTITEQVNLKRKGEIWVNQNSMLMFKSFANKKIYILIEYYDNYNHCKKISSTDWSKITH